MEEFLEKPLKILKGIIGEVVGEIQEIFLDESFKEFLEKLPEN